MSLKQYFQDQHSEPPPKRPKESPGSGQDGELWSVKYQPRRVDQIVGHKTNIDKLKEWLRQWKRKGAPPQQKAVLISGAPGIGKTTVANLVAAAEGFDVLEYNASDLRSKKALQESISTLISNQSVHPKPAVLVMDEVDGMSAGDKGGILELIQLIKHSKTPIICICNDRNSVKVRSLANYCLDLRFRVPDARQLAPCIERVCRSEGLTITRPIIDQMAESSHGDIRQILNQLYAWKLTGTQLNSAKDMDKNLFSTVPEFLSASHYTRNGINRLLEFYFGDSSMVPLMIQQNYLSTIPRPDSGPATSEMDGLAAASDSIAMADTIDRLIHGAAQEWGLAPLHGFLSCVVPAHHVCGQIQGQIRFSDWMGQNSKTAKNERILSELAMHMSLHVSSRSELRLVYIPHLVESVCHQLSGGAGQVDAVVGMLDFYAITKEDYECMLGLGVGRCNETLVQQRIPPSVKSALTRKYNSGRHNLPYDVTGVHKQHQEPETDEE